MKKCICAFAVLSFLAFPCAARAVGPDLQKDLLAASGSIRPCDPYDLCKTISSPDFAGRLTGSPGFTAAATWAGGTFKEWGLAPLGAAGGYLQPFPSPYTVVDTAAMTLLLPERGGAAAPAKEWKLEAPKDFMPLLFAASGDTIAAVVFAGWGISAPELGYDDYAGIDAAGKFVLCFRGTPDRDNEAFEEHDQHRARMLTAKDKGALGLIYIYDEPNAHPNGDWLDGFMPAMIGAPVADSLFAEKGLTSAAVKEKLVKTKAPFSFPLGSRVRYVVRSRHYPDGVGYNVAAMIEGSDPALRNECVVIGAHLDHCGSHMGLVFTGADDNASGSAVVMEIAHAYASLERRPKRSVVFALFGGEEEGLVGSTFLAAHFPPRFTKIAGMFNFDMVGEGDRANCGYTAQPAGLLDALKGADARVHTLASTWEIKHVGVRSSDFAPFYLKGAGCVACFSNGPHVAYHETGDTIYRINPDMLADVARLGFLASYRWANR
jgi:hypothetical protein